MHFLRALRSLFLLAVTILTVISAATGCETYDSPPRPSIDGLVEGALADPTAPIILRFSEKVVRESVILRIVKLKTDTEGNLADEDDDDSTVLQEFLTYDPAKGNEFGRVTFQDGDTAVRLEPGVCEVEAGAPASPPCLEGNRFSPRPLPIGPSLAIVLEPGLEDVEGRRQKTRMRLVFSYRLNCDSAQGTDAFPSGVYFFVAEVDKPVQTQIQLYGSVRVDPATGGFVGQFTNADRHPDPNRCSPACASTEACRLLPEEKCVPPSEKAGNEDEFPDFVANPTPPSGYSFEFSGCVVEDGGAVTFINLPADVDIVQPDLFIQGIQLIASFQDEGGVLRASGSVTAEQVLIGTTPSGSATGTVTARLVPPEEVPPGIPPAPEP